MALILCPECNQSISDKSDVCIHCGYPLSEMRKYVCRIKEQEFDLTTFTDDVLSGKLPEAQLILQICQRTRCNMYEGEYLVSYIKQNERPPKILKSMTCDEYQRTKPATCPKCGSTSITTGARGVNLMWGLIGASKTVNRCASCGHTWKPKR